MTILSTTVTPTTAYLGETVTLTSEVSETISSSHITMWIIDFDETTDSSTTVWELTNQEDRVINYEWSPFASETNMSSEVQINESMLNAHTLTFILAQGGSTRISIADNPELFIISDPINVSFKMHLYDKVKKLCGQWSYYKDEIKEKCIPLSEITTTTKPRLKRIQVGYSFENNDGTINVYVQLWSVAPKATVNLNWYDEELNPVGSYLVDTRTNTSAFSFTKNHITPSKEYSGVDVIVFVYDELNNVIDYHTFECDWSNQMNDDEIFYTGRATGLDDSATPTIRSEIDSLNTSITNKLDNKNFITTSFTPSKLKTEERKAIVDKSNVSLEPIIYNSLEGAYEHGGLIEFEFECNTSEYYEFNIVIQSNTSIKVCDYDDETNVYATLNTGTHTFKIGKNQLVINNTSITYTKTRISFVNLSTTAEGRFYFSNKQWYHEATFFDKIYPIGSIHITTNSVNPSNYFDGEWERIQDTFLLASGATYENGATGGSATVTLTAAQSGVPAHSHKYQDYNTTYTLKTTNRKPGTSTAVAYGTSLTAGGGATERTSSNNTAANASQAHNNMPPYLAVYMWERVG